MLRPTIRRGEAAAAPFLVSLTTKSTAGALMSRSDPTVVAAASNRDQFQRYDEADVLLPVGTRGTVGQRFVSVHRSARAAVAAEPDRPAGP